MNLSVALLFVNIMLTMVCVAILVHWILQRDYLPVIRRLEREQEAAESSGDAAKRRAVSEHEK